MNWYELVKIAQFLDNNDLYSLEDYIIAVYELEYKRSMIQNNQFKGMPARKENVIRNIEDRLEDVTGRLKEVFVNCFKDWLDWHNLSSPSQFAKKRLNNEESGLDREERVESIFANIKELGTRISDQDVSKMIDKCILSSQYLKDKFSGECYEHFMNNYSDYLSEDEEYTVQWVNRIFDKKMKTAKKVDVFISSLDEAQIAEVYWPYFVEVMFPSLKYAAEALNDNDFEELMGVIYREVYHPMWVKNWIKNGNSKTNKAIEDVYNLLIQANSLNSLLSAINLAINTAHTTGDMVDYLQLHIPVETDARDLIKLMNKMTHGDHEEWDNELEMIGVVLPNALKERNDKRKKEDRELLNSLGVNEYKDAYDKYL